MVDTPPQTPRPSMPVVVEVFGPTPPPVTPAPLPPVQPIPPIPGPLFDPVDVLTFHYNKNMAYAPAAKTYDVRFFFLFYSFPDRCLNLTVRAFFAGGHRYGARALARAVRV
jgi:hypothetical protein